MKNNKSCRKCGGKMEVKQNNLGPPSKSNVLALISGTGVLIVYKCTRCGSEEIDYKL